MVRYIDLLWVFFWIFLFIGNNGSFFYGKVFKFLWVFGNFIVIVSDNFFKKFIVVCLLELFNKFLVINFVIGNIFGLEVGEILRIRIRMFWIILKDWL